MWTSPAPPLGAPGRPQAFPGSLRKYQHTHTPPKALREADATTDLPAPPPPPSGRGPCSLLHSGQCLATRATSYTVCASSLLPLQLSLPCLEKGGWGAGWGPGNWVATPDRLGNCDLEKISGDSENLEKESRKQSGKAAWRR